MSISAKMTETVRQHVSQDVAQTAKSLIEAISDAVIVCTTKGQIAFINMPARQLMKDVSTIGDNRIEELTIFDLFPQSTDSINKILSLCRTQSGIFPGVLQTGKGCSNAGDADNLSRLPLQCSMLRLGCDRPSHILLRFIDVNAITRQRFNDLNKALRKKNRQLLIEREISRKDTLTGLLQRSTLFDELPRYVQDVDTGAKPTCFAVLDLDNFKEINDLYGHPCGDKVLSDIGKLLIDECRSLDKAGRIGGEEFALILPNTSFEDANKVCHRIRTRIKQTPVIYDGHEITLTSSFGLTEVRIGEAVKDIYKRADYALYSAKKAGRNKVATITANSEKPKITSAKQMRLRRATDTL